MSNAALQGILDILKNIFFGKIYFSGKIHLFLYKFTSGKTRKSGHGYSENMAGLQNNVHEQTRFKNQPMRNGLS
jgi:hypothetical protein